MPEALADACWWLSEVEARWLSEVEALEGGGEVKKKGKSEK